jgi:hypothetical protein
MKKNMFLLRCFVASESVSKDPTGEPKAGNDRGNPPDVFQLYDKHPSPGQFSQIYPSLQGQASSVTE